MQQSHIFVSPQRLILCISSVDKERLMTIGLYLRSGISPSPGATASSAMLDRFIASVNAGKSLFLCSKPPWHLIKPETFSMLYPTSNRAEPGTEITWWRERQSA